MYRKRFGNPNAAQARPQESEEGLQQSHNDPFDLEKAAKRESYRVTITLSNCDGLHSFQRQVSLN
jgi:hypothetical protein